MKVIRARMKNANGVYSLMKKTKEVHLTSNIYSRSFEKKIIKNPSTYAIVAEEKGRVIGLLTAAIWKNLSASYWDMLIVDNKLRNKGIGKKLYDNYISYLKKNGITYIWGLTKTSNEKIGRLLQKFKFKKRALCYYYDKEIK